MGRKVNGTGRRPSKSLGQVRNEILSGRDHLRFIKFVENSTVKWFWDIFRNLGGGPSQ